MLCFITDSPYVPNSMTETYEDGTQEEDPDGTGDITPYGKTKTMTQT